MGTAPDRSVSPASPIPNSGSLNILKQTESIRINTDNQNGVEQAKQRQRSISQLPIEPQMRPLMANGADVSVKASKPAQEQNINNSEMEEIDESEIDYEGEEKAHDKVNQIPNSQVNRNQ